MTRTHSTWALILAVLFAITSLSTGDAEARKRRGRVTSKANAKALHELMGAFKFGMTPDQVIGVLSEQIKERYAEEISATYDVYRQDELRRERDEEIKRLRESVVEFDGKKGGWDVSIIDDQFAHGTDESMMVHWETHQGRNQRRFFFFHDGRLYKMFIALDTSALGKSRRNFAFFRTLMEQRFGQGEVTDTGIIWRLRRLRVEALDKVAFYDAFCLIVTDPRRERRVLAVRKARLQKPDDRNAIIDAITEDGDSSGPSLDDGSHVIDSILTQ